MTLNYCTAFTAYFYLLALKTASETESRDPCGRIICSLSELLLDAIILLCEVLLFVAFC